MNLLCILFTHTHTVFRMKMGKTRTFKTMVLVAYISSGWEVEHKSTSLSQTHMVTSKWLPFVGRPILGTHASNISYSHMMGRHWNSRAVNKETMNNQISPIIHANIPYDHKHIQKFIWGAKNISQLLTQAKDVSNAIICKRTQHMFIVSHI